MCVSLFKGKNKLSLNLSFKAILKMSEFTTCFSGRVKSSPLNSGTPRTRRKNSSSKSKTQISPSQASWKYRLSTLNLNGNFLLNSKASQ